MPSSMDQLERATVQLWEAKRLAGYGDVAHGRLALLLLDNAAETSLMRSAEVGFLRSEMYSRLAWELRHVASDPRDQHLRQKIEAHQLSRRRRRQIERNFDTLVDYVFSQDTFALPQAFAECLRILHRYRNAAYHRDVVQPDVLGPAVQIYFYLCCQLLKNEQHFVYEIGSIPPAVAAILGESTPETSWPGGDIVQSGALADHVANHLLSETGLDHVGIASALSDHLVGRVAALERRLDEIADSGPRPLKRWEVLQLVQQFPVDREDYEEEVPPDFWTRAVPVTERVLEAWKSAAQQLRTAQIAYDALREFAAVEQPLEVLEEPVQAFIEAIDYEVQRAFDERRGK